jgi:hypothetical protein
MAEPYSLTTAFVGNVDSSLTADVIKEWFAQRCGPVEFVQMNGPEDKPYRFCFVEFASSEGRDLAMALNQTSLAGRSLKIGPCKGANRNKSAGFNGGRPGGMMGGMGGGPGGAGMSFMGGGGPPPFPMMGATPPGFPSFGGHPMPPPGYGIGAMPMMGPPSAPKNPDGALLRSLQKSQYHVVLQAISLQYRDILIKQAKAEYKKRKREAEHTAEEGDAPQQQPDF